MARRWVVLTAARSPFAVNEIIEYTEWDNRPVAADEVIYTDPVDLGNNPIDGNWKVGGTVTRSGATYIYTDLAGQFAPHITTTDVGRKRAAVEAALDQLNRWRASLTAQGHGHPSAIQALGHDLILGQRKALYLRAVTPAFTVQAIESYSEQISYGSSDITNVATFYRLATSLTKGAWLDGDPVEWATLSGAVATRRALQAAITAAPTDFRVAVRNFSSIDLGTNAWVTTAITS